MVAQGAAGRWTLEQWCSDWVEQAACRGVDTELFFSTSRSQVAKATRICERCLVQTQCLKAADRLEQGLGLKMISGIWGGLTADERIVRRRVLNEVHRRRSAAANLPSTARPTDSDHDADVVSVQADQFPLVAPGVGLEPTTLGLTGQAH